MPNPPAGVRLTMQAASVMFEVKPILKDDPMYPTRKKPDWWATAQRYLLAGVFPVCDDRLAVWAV
jgi:dynein heavy chain